MLLIHGFGANTNHWRFNQPVLAELKLPVDLIWGEHDPWEPVTEAERWAQTLNCVRSFSVIQNAGHCPHDEAPDQVNPVLQMLINKKSIQQAT